MSTSIAAWVNQRFSARLVWKRALFIVCCGVVPAQVLWYHGQGILGLVAMTLVGFPLRYRLTLEAAGVVCGWSLVRETIPYSDITDARVVPDPRRWVIFGRPVLELGRPNGPPRLVFGNERKLSAFAAELRERLPAAAT